MNAVTESNTLADYKVTDLALADWGRKEIAIAETEMPGLLAIRDEFAPACPCGRPHRGLAAHDDPDRGADRNAAGARRRSALGVVQHLSRPRITRRRRSRSRGTPVFAGRARRWRSTGSTRIASSSGKARGRIGPN